ncbi:ribosomal RNA processing protein 1 homolog B isoform X2 [Oncorhynchus mykiss]|uniref:ribosomal RNA processing protein 1 homolog B isoform X2 n=1 Tax=Oncorhynchus mykiss TaxID=8022 RepID=UPI00187875FC|nr:ribosomal RNA processing protein 1 homolog B isoform X2 [Oncorhynchus mykiss]
MAPVQQEPEIQFAQRLASNERPMRTKAIKKLRKYIRVRSQKIQGGFEGDELLKLWKGLFYCLWMQDKPLLQEELSNQISGLIHSFQNIQSQFMFLETFLQTIKREWTGIDRLRMDKFFQLVRFVFRNTFEMMKRKEWETSVVTRFLELLTAQVLHSSSGAPCGLQFHILDIYMTELAAVGSAELTAAQNMTFIDPFCKTASKTKDRILLKAICSSIFSAIVDQAPFAIEDLLKEVKATGGGAEESDSGQASEEEGLEKDPPKGKKTAKEALKKTTGGQTNGTVSTEEEDDDDEDGLGDEDDDEMLHMESDSESEMPDDAGIGPVLQFDYLSLADRLFGLARRSNTPSHNRQRLYKVVKTLRDLSEGVFPQDEYPEEVSTDEDDDEMFGSRKRMKRGRGFGEEEEEESSPAKKWKGKKKDSKARTSDQTAATDDSKPAETPGDSNNKKKKKKRRKKTTGEVKTEEQNGVAAKSEVKVEKDTTPASVPQMTDSKEAETEPSIPAKGTDTGASLLKEKAKVVAMETGVQSGTPQDVVVGNLSSVTVMEVDQKKQSETPVPDATSSKKKNIKKSKTPAPKQKEEVAEPAKSAPETATTTPSRRKNTKQEPEEQTTVEEVEMALETVDETTATPPKNKRRRRRNKVKRNAETDTTQVDLEPDSTPAEEPPVDLRIAATPLKKKKLKVAKAGEESAGGETRPGTEADVLVVDTKVEPACVATSTSLKKKKKKHATAEEQSVEAECQTPPKADANLTLIDAEVQTLEAATPTPLKNKKHATAEVQTLEAATPTPLKKKKHATAEVQTLEAATPTPLKKKKHPTAEVQTLEAATPTPLKKKKHATAEVQTLEAATPTPLKKKKKSSGLVAQELETTTVEESVSEEQPTDADLDTSLKKGKKKRKVPVVIEFEAEVNGMAGGKKAKLSNDSRELSTPVSAKKTKKMTPKKAGAESDFITFQNHATIPTPLFFKTTKGSPSTPLSSKKKCPTPKSESKKVTFGLNKNKTAGSPEFRKTDRSLLVSPEGSSRVPFDPQQKPLFGVLKSPEASLTKSTKKTKSTLKTTPKRPTAADFF